MENQWIKRTELFLKRKLDSGIRMKAHHRQRSRCEPSEHLPDRS